MNDFSLIKACVDWCEGPKFDIFDNSYPYYAINFNQKIKNNWCSVHEKCDFKPFSYFKTNFKFRIKWQIKAWGFSDNLVQVFQETYNENNKNICIKLNSDNYADHKTWCLKSIKLSKDCNFNLYIVSKFMNRLKLDFLNSDINFFNSIDNLESFKNKENIYAIYTIDRKEILTNTANWWESGLIFINHSRPIKSWHHPEDWIGMNAEEIYNSIMDI